MATIILIEQDVIDSFCDIAGSFFRDILDMDAERVLLTDLSTLSDFSFSGDYKSDLPDSAALGEMYADWDRWVLSRIKQQYGVCGVKPNTSLLVLFEAIRANNRPFPVH